jgi:hypothetical protein
MITPTEHSIEFHIRLSDRSLYKAYDLSGINYKFQDRMAQAMTVSYHKYGPVAEAYPHKVNAISSLKKRLKLYKETGNGDYLIDVANFAMIEFMFPANEKAFYDKVDELLLDNANTLDYIDMYLDSYKMFGDMNLLILVAAIAKREYYHPSHEAFHDTPTDGGEGRVWHSGGPANSRDNQGERMRF